LIKPNKEHFANYLSADITIHQFNFTRTVQAFLPLLSFIRKKNPHIVFSTLTHLNFILGIVKFFVNRKILFVARESSIISSSLKDEKFSALFRFCYKWVYRNFDLIICQSNAMANDLVTNFKLNPSLIKVIYNPVDFDLVSASIASVEKTNSSSPRVELLCVGRLHPAKGYDRLLKAISIVKHLDFRLKIIGDGPLKEELEKMTTTLRLTEKVNFLGIQENPFHFMAQADCLLLPSYYEGLPDVVLEANACGLPVIAFNSPGGTAEIIQDGLNGWLIQDGDLEAFARKIEAREYLAMDKEKIISFVSKNFSLDKITTEYEDAILSIRSSS
jgi:glycosyltransferase involved in cell wall biosynthesis